MGGGCKPGNKDPEPVTSPKFQFGSMHFLTSPLISVCSEFLNYHLCGRNRQPDREGGIAEYISHKWQCLQCLFKFKTIRTILHHIIETVALCETGSGVIFQFATKRKKKLQLTQLLVSFCIDTMQNNIFESLTY